MTRIAPLTYQQFLTSAEINAIAGFINTGIQPGDDVSSNLYTLTRTGAFQQSLAAKIGRIYDVADNLNPNVGSQNAAQQTVALAQAFASGLPVLLPPYPLTLLATTALTTPGQPLIGWGRSLSQLLIPATFPQTLALSTSASVTSGNALPFTATSQSIAGVAVPVVIGVTVSGPNIPAGATVIGVIPNTSVEISANVTGTVGANSVITFGVGGVITVATGEPGALLESFTVAFTQMDTATPGSLTQFPPALYVAASPRVKLNDIRLQAGMRGLVFNGNCGGSVFDNIESSCLQSSVEMSGCLDTMRGAGLHVFPFGLTANQQTVFNSAFNTPVKLGRVDGCRLLAPLILAGRNSSIVCYSDTTNPVTSEQGAPELTVVGGALDTNGGLIVQAGIVDFLGGEITLGDGHSSAVTQTGGKLRMRGTYVTQAVIGRDTGYNSMVDLLGGFADIDGCLFESGPSDVVCVNVSSGQLVNIRGGYMLDQLVTGSRSLPRINIVGATASINSVMFSAESAGLPIAFTGGSRVAISLTGDSQVSIGDCTGGGYTIADTVTPQVTNYSNNVGFSNDRAGDAVINEHQRVLLEYSSDGSGNVTAVHNLTSNAWKYIRNVLATYMNGAVCTPLTFVSSDATYLHFSGAAATVPVTISFSFITTP